MSRRTGAVDLLQVTVGVLIVAEVTVAALYIAYNAVVVLLMLLALELLVPPIRAFTTLLLSVFRPLWEAIWRAVVFLKDTIVYGSDSPGAGLRWAALFILVNGLGFALYWLLLR